MMHMRQRCFIKHQKPEGRYSQALRRHFYLRFHFQRSEAVRIVVHQCPHRSAKLRGYTQYTPPRRLGVLQPF